MSVGIVTVAYGDTYRAFLPEWARAVQALTTQPDHFAIVTDRIDKHVEEAIDLLPPRGVAFTSDTPFRHHPQVLVNEAIREVPTDWVVKIDVDDLILPHALDNLPEDADVLMYGIVVQRATGEQVLLSPACTWRDILNNPHNLIFSGSPFRKWLWHSNQIKDMMYEDWTFWLGCAKQQARFAASTQADYVYRLADHNISNTIDDAYWRSIVESLK